VSVEVISWALNLAPVPADRGGQPSSVCKFVLVGLANHAGPDGTGAFPSVATLVRYTGLSERTVRTCLDRLEAAGIVSPCDPGIVAARIKRADRRRQGWNLNLSLVRDDLDDAAIAVVEHQFPGLSIRLRRPDSAMSARAGPPRLSPGRLGYARRNPRRGNRTPRRTLSADLHAPPRSPGRRLQPAEPPHPCRVTPRGGQQHPIRDDRVVRGPDGGRQILRVISVDQHPRARVPGRAVRPPRRVPDLPARELPLQLAPALTVPHSLSPPQ
jgi:hypothetical protein